MSINDIARDIRADGSGPIDVNQGDATAVTNDGVRCDLRCKRRTGCAGRVNS